MSDSAEDLLAALIERRERGEDVDIEAFVRARPGRERELREALSGLGLLDERLDAVGVGRPAQVGRYRVVGEIARGGMGRVLRAVDPERPERPVALKLLDALGTLGARARERFRREAETLRALEHPGVVRVLDAGVDGGVPWIAMELVEGETLAAVLARARAAGEATGAPSRPFTSARAAAIVAELARAVEAVHAAGVLHRDVKPGNVILTPAGHVVLVDFGLVREEGTATLTRTGDLLGTPQYMAPEQARGERADERSDVWGIGAVLYELLALRPPHGGQGGPSDPLQVLDSVRSRSVPRLGRAAPEVPRELDRIAARALAFRRARRTPSAAALARDLEAFVEGRPVEARPPSVLERLDEAWRVHRGKLPLAAGLALLAVGAFLFVRELGRREAARERALLEDVIGRWVTRDAEGAREAAEVLARETPEEPFTRLLIAVARGEEPPPSDVPAVEAAARGWSASRAGRHDEALDALQTARTLAPEEPVPLLLLARAAERAQRLDLAAREYRAATERFPERAEVHARLSAVHWARRDEAEAERAILRAIELAPDVGAHRFSLARILARMDRKEEALEAAELGLQLSGDAASKLQLQILAGMLDQAGRHEEARELLQRVLARWSRDPQALYNLAYSYMLDHHLREAVEACEELSGTRDRSMALASLAWIYSGSDRKSCAECRAAYAGDPELLDLDRAEELALEALERNDSDQVPMLVARISVIIDRRAPVAEVLEELQALEEDDRRIALFERALRVLRE